ncbi:MAG: biopolymer transporter ExbD [Victivallales bacterium]|jgi:biopolymer transport protein ExbD|nr:biopolymer transporter ExbD [Victivallales bacterium]
MHYRFPATNSNMSAGSLSSMIDIVFLLIIFFVVTASFDREQIDAEVSLPTVDSAAVKSLPQQRLMVNVLADGSVKLGFYHLSAGEVAARLGDLMRSQGDRKAVLIVSGDRNTPHKYISAVMNSAAQAGFSQVRINAEVKKEGK